MNQSGDYKPALSLSFLTPLYEPLMALTNWERTFKSQLRRQAEVQPGMRVLDLGCGPATLTVALKQEQPAAEVHGLDGDEQILATARRKSYATRSEILFANALSTSMPYPEDFFDRVITSLFFHHLSTENKKKTLHEILRVLKPDGQLHVADWGKPANWTMRLAQQLIILLDGATTRDSFEGKLPEFMSEAGFTGVSEHSQFNTVCGTVRLHTARKGSTAL